mmetsp:Transcript_3927/g.10843  ORF Transcript_3927/g.10843 Transcript_3927/m.10843 type:complete len:117 (-) Transcript_3927:2784-3134(-)
MNHPAESGGRNPTVAIAQRGQRSTADRGRRMPRQEVEDGGECRSVDEATDPVGKLSSAMAITTALTPHPGPATSLGSFGRCRSLALRCVRLRLDFTSATGEREKGEMGCWMVAGEC